MGSSSILCLLKRIVDIKVYKYEKEKMLSYAFESSKFMIKIFRGEGVVDGEWVAVKRT